MAGRGGQWRPPFREETGLSTFTIDALGALPGPEWLRRRRAEAFERFETGAAPTEAEEVWRYSRIDDLDLDAYTPVTAPAAPAGADMGPDVAPILEAVGEWSAVLVVRNGAVVHAEMDPALAAEGVVVGPLAATPAGRELLGSVARPADVLAELSTAFMLDAAFVHVPRGVVVDRPVLVLNRVDAEGGAVFPRLVVRAEELASVTVLDHIASPPGTSALVGPTVEIDVADAAQVSYLGVQELGTRVWQVGTHSSAVGRDATLTSATVALGGDYARVRFDSRLVGQGGTSNLLAVYFGDGTQMHDFRTMQDHEGPKTTSDLLFKGAVEDRSHSVYSGLIRVRKGAAGTNAFQTNRNLVLTEGAHADSVPNLEIEENDVRCSHASAVGPIDDDHRYYLEARGVPPEVADRLIVLGFFDEVIERTPVPGLRGPLRRAVAAKLHAIGP